MSEIKHQSRKGALKFINAEKNLFFSKLKKRVDIYFADRQISRLGNTKLFVKTLVLLVIYFGPFVALLTWNPGWVPGLLLWTIMSLKNNRQASGHC